MRPFRFSLQIDPSTADLDTVGRAAEEAGFDVLTTSDHVGASRSPLLALTHVAARTSSIGLGTMVLNNDMRNPVQLAWDAATLQHLSGGRFELGLGAGHTPHEYAATGITLDPPADRKARLAASVEIIGALLRGETVDHHSDWYDLEGAHVGRPDAGPPPILVGGNGERLLRAAAATADIIGLQGLGRTLPDGHRHTVRFGPERLDAQIDCIRSVDAGGRVELQALVQRVEFTDDRAAAIAELCQQVDGLDPADAAETPFLAIGTVEEITAQVLAARERWGISYLTVRNPAFGAVIARIREHEAA